MVRRTIKRINLADVEYTAFQLAKKFMEWSEPIPEFETRFPDKLESCIETPFQTFDRKSLYKGLIGKSSILFYLMIKNHPFQNGNKRIAIMTLFHFLGKNGKWLSISNETLYKFAKDVASSKPRSRERVTAHIQEVIRTNLIDLPK